MTPFWFSTKMKNLFDELLVPEECQCDQALVGDPGKHGNSESGGEQLHEFAPLAWQVEWPEAVSRARGLGKKATEIGGAGFPVLSFFG